MLRGKVKSRVVLTERTSGQYRPLARKEEIDERTLKRTLKALLYAGAALMVVVAGSANWPNH